MTQLLTGHPCEMVFLRTFVELEVLFTTIEHLALGKKAVIALFVDGYLAISVGGAVFSWLVSIDSVVCVDDLAVE